VSRFEDAIARFAAAHDEDPKGLARRYHERLAAWVARLDPAPSEALQLAARCQHLRRWTQPRSAYPMTTEGYKRWRAALARFHAEEAGRILREVGYDDETVEAVGGLLVKKGLRRDPQVQLLEDAICLTFLELELEELAGRTAEDKVVEILQKTWAKMSPAGHAAALALAPSLPEGSQRLLARALG
jgi:hypothetical protein